jgi:hypothetical protein
MTTLINVSYMHRVLYDMNFSCQHTVIISTPQTGAVVMLLRTSEALAWQTCPAYSTSLNLQG